MPGVIELIGAIMLGIALSIGFTKLAELFLRGLIHRKPREKNDE